jgi:hypothetical protein
LITEKVNATVTPRTLVGPQSGSRTDDTDGEPSSAQLFSEHDAAPEDMGGTKGIDRALSAAFEIVFPPDV